MGQHQFRCFNNRKCVMSSKKTTKKTDVKKPVIQEPSVTLPEGFDTLDQSLDSMWTHDTPLYVKPFGYTLSDNKLGQGAQKRVNVLIHCHLLQSVEAKSLNEETKDEILTFHPGATIGIWYKPGLRNLLLCHECETYVAPNGEKDVGQILPMKVFVVAKKRGQKSMGEMPCLGDYRKETRRQPLPWDNGSATAKPPTTAVSDDYDDTDVPF